MLNVVVLMGRLTADAELRTSKSGVSVTSFTVAVERAFQKQGTERQTDFIKCVAWRNTAEFISKYFAKGQMIAVNGRLQQNSYTDKEGNKRTTYDVVVDNASFCGGKSESKSADVEREDTDYNDADISGFEEMNDADLPF